MRNSWSCLMCCFLVVGLVGCSDGGCTYRANIGTAESALYQTESGQLGMSYADSDGNVDVPCGASVEGVLSQ